MNVVIIITCHPCIQASLYDTVPVNGKMCEYVHHQPERHSKVLHHTI